uniref:HlyC/CorC family transporter n=1 Tax=Desulfobacca acetoxidans TaxID=60893 RepID=A0A7V4G829_9BACT
MQLETTLKFIGLGLIMLLCGLFAGAETSLFALDPVERLRLKERHPRRGFLVESLLSRPRTLLITLLIGVETICILASVLSTSLALDLYGPRGKWVALWVFAPLFLLFGELIPKSLALAFPARVAHLVSPLVKPAVFLLAPVRLVALQVSRGILATLGFRPELPVHTVRQEDFIRLVEESHASGMIAALERDFIQNFLALGDVRVGQLMVPRPDIFSLPINLPVPEMIRAVKLARFSRVPVYQDQPGEILGILHGKDLLYLSPRDYGDPDLIRRLLRPPHYVPENKRAFDLLTEMQSRHLRLALVVDEYGTLVGLISLEDLLEELCGEIPQEFQKEEQAVREVGPGCWRVKAGLSLVEFNELMGLELPTEEFDTVGGFVLHLFGELPREGDLAAHQGLVFKIIRTKGTRLLELEVRREQP